MVCRVHHLGGLRWSPVGLCPPHRSGDCSLGRHVHFIICTLISCALPVLFHAWFDPPEMGVFCPLDMDNGLYPGHGVYPCVRVTACFLVARTLQRQPCGVMFCVPVGLVSIILVGISVGQGVIPGSVVARSRTRLQWYLSCCRLRCVVLPWV